jgi:glutamate dehydrogenase/leucine dehydrogenase
MIAHAPTPHVAPEPVDSFAQATLRFEMAARSLDLEDWIVQRLRHPERELTLSLPYLADAGEARTATAYRVQH